MSFEARFALIAERMDPIDLEAFPEHLKCPVVQCYRRTVIGARHTDTEPGFEAVLAHWRLQCDPIHDYPPVLMYRALGGLYRMTMYRLENGVPVPSEDRMITQVIGFITRARAAVTIISSTPSNASRKGGRSTCTRMAQEGIKYTA